ncbi:membrane protein insertion efficiency factor YidD [Mycobacterium spongiae]|uniref:Putative membrane protein insertion efficiency factor n=1 Tax=Mycobacterium spongiae TaxID=886343 RepID=A0A975K200_9MYCO|nr:membrane protein insertion efficiency factor YidD [Mycobacterium spongiae]
MTSVGRRCAGLIRGTGAVIARVLIFLVQNYRHMVSPLRPASCRFVPTCSQYAVDALTEYGVIRGGWLTVARLAKCGPWHRGGWDPIPERPHRQADFDEDGTGGETPATSGESELLV